MITKDLINKIYIRERMNLPEYLKPVDITQEGANEEIKRMGELARAMISYDLVCGEHGVFAQEIQKQHLEREEERHRNKLHCYHKIKVVDHLV